MKPWIASIEALKDSLFLTLKHDNHTIRIELFDEGPNCISHFDDKKCRLMDHRSKLSTIAKEVKAIERDIKIEEKNMLKKSMDAEGYKWRV